MMVMPLDFTGIGNPIVVRGPVATVYADQGDVWFPFNGLVASNGVVLQVLDPLTKVTTTLVRDTDYQLVFPLLKQSVPESSQFYIGVRLLSKNLTGELILRCFSLGGDWVIDATDINEFLTTYYLNTGYVAIANANPKIYSNFKLDLSTQEAVLTSFESYTTIRLSVCYVRQLNIPTGGDSSGGTGSSGGGGNTSTGGDGGQLYCAEFDLSVLQPSVVFTLAHGLGFPVIGGSLKLQNGELTDPMIRVVDLNTVELRADVPTVGSLYLFYMK